MRITLVLAALAVAALAVVPSGPAAGGAVKPVGTLKGTVGPGFTIALAKKPTKAGTYKLVVADKSSIHNFRLVGTSAVTSVAGTGTKTFTVALKAGKTYRFLCDPHRTSMVGTFTVPKK